MSDLEAQLATCRRQYNKQTKKLGHVRAEVERLRTEVRRSQVNCDRVARIRKIDIPEGESEEFRRGFAHAAWLVSKAMEGL